MKVGKIKQSKTRIFVVICLAVLLVAGCSSNNEKQESGSLDKPPFDFSLPETVTGNANDFEQGLNKSISETWSIEAYEVDDSVNNTLDYYRNNIVGWGEPKYSKNQVKSFTFHYLEFTKDEDVAIIGSTHLKGTTYLAIIGQSK